MQQSRPPFPHANPDSQFIYVDGVGRVKATYAYTDLLKDPGLIRQTAALLRGSAAAVVL